MRSTLLATALIALVATGCGQSTDAPPATTKAKPEANPKTPDPQQAKKAADALKGAKADPKGKTKDKKGKGPTIEEYEVLLLGLKDCSIRERGIDTKCEAYKTFNKARRNRSALNASGGLSALGAKHIKHESPAIRIQSASMMGSLFGASADNQAVIIEAAKTEKNGMVLASMLRTIGSSISKNTAARDLVMANANHSDTAVRKIVVQSLTSTWARDTEGTLEKAMEMLEKDPSNEVREQACRRLGARADERALPLLEKYTADAKKNPKMYKACFAGLIAMWAAPIAHKVPSQKAYDLTLKRLSAKPRTEQQPPWTTISSLGWASNETFQETAPWYKNDAVLDVLVDLVKDRDSNWLGRTTAVDTLKKLGVKKQVLKALKKDYAAASGKPGPDKHVLDKIEKALSKKKRR